MALTAFDLAQRFVGMKEVSGKTANPAILAMLRLDTSWPEDDAVPWCSAFVNYICWLARLPRSKSLRARSWLEIGQPLSITTARPGLGDVVVLNRGGPPSPTVIKAPGHVGFFAGEEGGRVLVLGGNQGDSVSVASFPIKDILGIRRLV